MITARVNCHPHGGWLGFSAKGGKKRNTQCFKSCLCNRVLGTRFEQRIKGGILSAGAVLIGLLLVAAQPELSYAGHKASGPVPGLTAALDRAAAQVGETVRLTLAYRLPAGARLPEKLNIGGLEGMTVLDRRILPDKIVVSLLADRLDTWKSQALSLSYVDGQGKTQRLTAPPVTLTVGSNFSGKAAPAQLRPIQGIIPTRSPWLPYVPWAAALVVMVGAGVWLLWLRKKKRLHEIHAEIWDPPHIHARKALDRLNREMLFETGRIKEFYFCFSEIIRQYLGAIRGFPAVELTTEEIATQVHHEQDRPLVDLLRQTDLVKFADTVPSATRKDEHVLTAVSFIEMTSPSPEGEKPDAPKETTRR